jgi:TonB family protein
MNSNRHSHGKWVIVCFVLLLLSGIRSTASAQVTIELKPTEKTITEDKQKFEDRRRVPAVSLPCSPEEAAWWNALRQASEAVKLSRGDKKLSKKFVQLLQAGAVKSFKAPIADHKPIVLSQTPPHYTSDGRRNRVSGVIALEVELQPDGTVGEVRVLNKLGSGLEKNVIEAARKAVFLPAVKDGKFVSFRVPVQMSFNVF